MVIRAGLGWTNGLGSSRRGGNLWVEGHPAIFRDGVKRNAKLFFAHTLGGAPESGKALERYE
jgi:hypothetical protein